MTTAAALTVARTPLVVVQDDALYDRIKRRGRFSIPREIAVSAEAYRLQPEKHLMFGALLHTALKKFIANIGKTHGLTYVPDQSWPGFELRGPTEHVSFSSNVAPDPGPTTKPRRFDEASLREWEAEEKARLPVRRLPLDVVDYEIVVAFQRKLPATFHTAAARSHTRKDR